MISSLRLKPEESAAFLALAKEQSTWRELLDTSRPAPVSWPWSRRVGAILRVAIRTARGGVADNRLEWIGAALVHDHSDRQFARLVAEVDGGVLEDRRLWRSRDSSRLIAARALLFLLLNAHGVGLFSRAIHPTAARGMAKGLVLLAVLEREYRRYGSTAGAIVLSFDFSPIRLALMIHAIRSGIPVTAVMHHYLRDWDGVREWHRIGRFDYVLCYEIDNALRILPPPSAVCILPAERLAFNPENDASLVAGIVVDNYVNPDATLELASQIANESSVAKVSIRRHPGAKSDAWPSPRHSRVTYSDSQMNLASFARSVDFVVGSQTTAMVSLQTWGMPCLSWSEFYRGMPIDFGVAEGLTAFSGGLAECLSAAREWARQMRSGSGCSRGREAEFRQIEPRELVALTVGPITRSFAAREAQGQV